MKTHKIKSLIYLSAFVVCAVVYYQMEQNEAYNDVMSTSQTADMQAEDLSSEDDDEQMESELE